MITYVSVSSSLTTSSTPSAASTTTAANSTTTTATTITTTTTTSATNATVTSASLSSNSSDGLPARPRQSHKSRLLQFSSNRGFVLVMTENLKKNHITVAKFSCFRAVTAPYFRILT